MTRSEESEVAPIEGRQLWLVEPLDDRENRSVDEADVGIGVPIAQVANSRIVGRGEVGHDVGTGLDVVEEGNKDSRIQSLLDPVVDFDENGAGLTRVSSAASINARQAA
jgi:hypothetical protein